jgi:DNA-damage-inducible protein J
VRGLYNAHIIFYIEYVKTKELMIMADMTNITIRMDVELKKQAEQRQAVRQQRIPFDVALDTPNAETLEALAEVQRMKKNRALGKTYTDVDVMMRELLS